MKHLDPWKREWLQRIRLALTGSPDRKETGAARLCGRLSLALQLIPKAKSFDRGVEEIAIAAKELRVLTEELEQLAIDLTELRSTWLGKEKEAIDG